MRYRLKPFWKQLVIDYLQLVAQASLPRRMVPGRIPLVRITFDAKKLPTPRLCCANYQFLKDFVKLFCFFELSSESWDAPMADFGVPCLL